MPHEPDASPPTSTDPRHDTTADALSGPAGPEVAGTPLSSWPTPTWTPHAVVFDCDGLLVDTESDWVATQDAYLASHGTSFTPEVRRSVTGRSAEVVVAAIAAAVDRDPRLVAEDLLALHREDLSRGPALLPGAERTVREIAARVPVAVASNSPRALLAEKLAGIGLADLVDATVAIEDVDAPKPAPDMYARAVALLGAAPGDALAFEDSETGAQAALAAGLVLIAVPSLPGQEPVAHLRLASLEDPDLHAWIGTWAAR